MYNIYTNIQMKYSKDIYMHILYCTHRPHTYDILYTIPRSWALSGVSRRFTHHG